MFIFVKIRKTIMIEVERVEHLEPSKELDILFSELHARDISVDVKRINRLISERNLAFYALKSDGIIIGMASVIPCRCATSDKLWIEDVCILGSERGKGLGKVLFEFVLEDARAFFGPGTFYLTSRPSRAAARQMYRSFGFVEQETGIFKL